MNGKKRFYYNTFYHADDMSRVLEYEIIDRESYPNYPNHNENEDWARWVIYIGENDSGWQDMLVDLLNELNDENKELKLQLEECRNNKLFSRRELEKENRQLKDEIEFLKIDNESLTDGAEKYVKLYHIVLKENEELKHFVEHYERWFRNEEIKEIVVGDCKVVLE